MRIKLKTRDKILLAILVLGFLLRFVGLGRIPGGFNADEASQAYSAFSLLKTGRDEWGISWPLLNFKSFLDYKAPLQTYLMIPSIAIFGLSEFAARLPSALFGLLTIYAFYRLISVLCREFLTDAHPHNAQAVPLVGALLLATSPWHIQFSRTALEANLVGFLVITGLWLFLEGLKDKRWMLPSALCFGLSIYAYHSAKIFVPLFATFLVFLFGWQRKISPAVKTFIIIAAVIAGPGLLDLAFGQSGTRGQDLLIFKLSPADIQEISDQRFYSPFFKISPSLPAIFHNKLTYIADRFIENYFSYWDLTFWFTQGGRETTYSIIPGRGLFYTWTIVFFLSGLVFFWRHYTTKKLGWLLLGWFLLAALPAAITKEGYRPNRASAYLGWFELVMAFGASYLFIKMRQYQRVFLALTTVVAVLGLAFYLNDYAFASAIKFPTSLAYGWREANRYLTEHQDEYDLVYIQRSGQPQSFIAFYQQLDPASFQQHTLSWNAKAEQQRVSYLDQIDRYQLGRYTFTHLNFPDDIHPNTLYLSGLLERLPQNRRTLYTVYAPGEAPMFEFFTFNQ